MYKRASEFLKSRVDPLYQSEHWKWLDEQAAEREAARQRRQNERDEAHRRSPAGQREETERRVLAEKKRADDQLEERRRKALQEAERIGHFKPDPPPVPVPPYDPDPADEARRTQQWNAIVRIGVFGTKAERAELKKRLTQDEAEAWAQFEADMKAMSNAERAELHTALRSEFDQLLNESEQR